VRQVTNAFATKLRLKAGDENGNHAAKGEGAATVAQEGAMGRDVWDYSEWRRVLGAFQLTAPVQPKHELLFREQRHLSVLLWIAQAIPHESRWYPVFQRYVDVIAGRVQAFGGDPTHVKPSPNGNPHGEPDGKPHDGKDGKDGKERGRHEGKIGGLIFDHFGDFEGFLLETAHGERRYFSREREIEL